MNKKILTILLFIASSLSFSYSETDVKKLKFTGICENCDFIGVNFFDYDFWEEKGKGGSKFNRAPPGAAQAPFFIDLSKKILNSSNFLGANLSNISLVHSELAGANLEETNLSGATLAYANLSEANFKYANLTGAYFRDTDLSRANFKNANLSGATFGFTNFSGASFKDANLNNIEVEDSPLEGLDFRGANLTGARLLGANLQGADFTGAIFRNVDISGAQIRNANFTAVDLSQTKMQKVSFKEAILCETIMPWGIEDSGCTKIKKPSLDMDMDDLNL